MPASLRTVEEVAALAGIDLYTMPPTLLDQLQASQESLERKLSPELAAAIPDEELPHLPPYTRESWAFAHNEDECSVIKLAEGIRQFSAAARELEDVLRPLLAKL
jgi:transaldolase